MQHPDTQQERRTIWTIWTIWSMTTEPIRLSKVFLAGLRTQPGPEDPDTALQIEQLTTGMAMGALASLSMISVCSMADNRQVISWDRLEAESARDSTTSTLVELINNGVPEDRTLWPDSQLLQAKV
jgi:hypothetical protein